MAPPPPMPSGPLPRKPTASSSSGTIPWSSGDPVADSAEYERMVNHLEEKTRLEQTAGKAVLYAGNEEWPFAIPIVKKDSLWRFDARQGREEILARRIGKNELSAIQFCLAYVDAQREYALKNISKEDIPEYAQKFMSDPGKKNGLYWETKEGEEPSPLGPAIAQAKKEGYKKSGDKPSPFNGYYFRMLKMQGKQAPEGAFEYIVKGKMTGGFAVVASPAKYGNSGVMTFIVNHDGVVYQKDLGKNTARIAMEMKSFDPDKTWKKTE